MTSYTDADVLGLLAVATEISQVLRKGALVRPNTGYHDSLNSALKPFRPTPEELRMDRGKAGYEAYVLGLESRFPDWDDLTDEAKEASCRHADASIAKQAEQDREAGT